jgi:hypothetical protein
MALSNMLREPRREITETAVGIVLVLGYAWINYTAARWLQSAIPLSGGFQIPVFLPMLAIFLGTFICYGALLLIHLLGEAVCNALQQNGLHLRPRSRPVTDRWRT